MRHAHFLVLTGRLNEFPLHELIETLRGQRKTGRLQVEFKAGPCALYFREGALVEAALGSLRGLEALSLALSLQQEDAAPFNFNPLVAPPEAPGPQAQANSTAAFARESAEQARARVIEVEPEAAGPATDARHDDPNVPRPAATQQPDASAAPPQLDTHTAPQPDARHAARQLEAPAAAARPRALLPAAEEGALVERLARIETVVAAQARRANIERAVYASLVAILVLAALLWRGRDAASDDGTTNVAGPASAAVSPPTAAMAGVSTTSTNNSDLTKRSDRDAAANEDAKLTAAADGNGTGANDPSASGTALNPTGGRSSSTGAPAPVETLATKPPARSADPRARQPSSTDRGAPAAGRQTATVTDGVAKPAAANRTGRIRGHVVQVRMTVVRGRVLRAEVGNPRAGMAAYEALALRMARQRRYPEGFSGQETLRLSVGQ
jgi:hypothetical protein